MKIEYTDDRLIDIVAIHPQHKANGTPPNEYKQSFYQQIMASFMYLHGKLTDMPNRFDLFEFIGHGNPAKPGIYRALVRIDNVTSVYASFFYWNSGTRSYQQRGLVVMQGDEMYEEDAMKKYNARTSVL